MNQRRRRTGSEAFRLVAQARVGSLVRENGTRLTAEDIGYLYALRANLFNWIEHIEVEIDRVSPRANVTDIVVGMQEGRTQV